MDLCRKKEDKFKRQKQQQDLEEEQESKQKGGSVTNSLLTQNKE